MYEGVRGNVRYCPITHPRRLSALQGEGDPILVVMIRGFFWPEDREQLEEPTRFYPQRAVGSCRLRKPA
jgi:hypothetical protein